MLWVLTWVAKIRPEEHKDLKLPRFGAKGYAFVIIRLGDYKDLELQILGLGAIKGHYTVTMKTLYGWFNGCLLPFEHHQKHVRQTSEWVIIVQRWAN